MEDNRLTSAVLFAKSDMDGIYFQDVFRTSVVILLILEHFQISFSIIFPRLQLCPLHWLVYRDLERPAFTGTVGVTLLLTHTRCCYRNTWESGWCQHGKRRARFRASVPAILQAPVTTGTLRYFSRVYPMVTLTQLHPSLPSVSRVHITSPFVVVINTLLRIVLSYIHTYIKIIL
jgi:hypothetical protein